MHRLYASHENGTEVLRNHADTPELYTDFAEVR